MANKMNNQACENHEICKIKSIRWKRRNTDSVIEIAQSVFEEYLLSDKSFRLSNHYNKRSFERVVSNNDILNVIKNGWVIESSNDDVTILGYSKHGKHYRAFHVVLAKKNFHNWTIKTIYSPESHEWKWNEFFDERICFCKTKEVF